MEFDMNAPATSLADQWKALLAKQPKTRIRDAAEQLNVSEAELLATELASKVQPLAPKWKDFMEAIAEAGPVMCLTRNDWVVIEKTGPFEELEFDGPVGVRSANSWTFASSGANGTSATPSSPKHRIAPCAPSKSSITTETRC